MTAQAPVWELARDEPGFPAQLLDLGKDAPESLFGCGGEELVRELALDRCVTIVGSRRASSYGLRVAEELGQLLAAAGLVIVSGMARGIDAAAHRGALAGGGPTIAVLGGGPDVVYPVGERRLYREILRAGAVISEASPGRRPEAWSFPVRNRIMAALAAMTVVVEAAQPSGSLITARQTLDLGRELGAVPGPVNSRVSEGTNDLIVDGAAPIRGAQDVLDRLLGVGEPHARRRGPALEPGLTRVAELVERGNASCDAVATAAAIPPADAAVALARLELLGYVRVDADGRYARTTLRPPGDEAPRADD
ncbi:MAG: DNA-processing protein DprA [Solirubrobacterales bacterium]